MSEKHRYPDWICTVCGETVFGSRSHCRVCHSLNPVLSSTTGTVVTTTHQTSSASASVAPDWACFKCNRIIFGSKNGCRDCDAKNPALDHQAQLDIAEQVTQLQKETEITKKKLEDEENNKTQPAASSSQVVNNSSSPSNNNSNSNNNMLQNSTTDFVTSASAASSSAASTTSSSSQKKYHPKWSTKSRRYYCGLRYTVAGDCECGNCDGLCGPVEGCQCNFCEMLSKTMRYCGNNFINPEDGEDSICSEQGDGLCPSCYQTFLLEIRGKRQQQFEAKKGSWKLFRTADFDLITEGTHLYVKTSPHWRHCIVISRVGGGGSDNNNNSNNSGVNLRVVELVKTSDSLKLEEKSIYEWYKDSSQWKSVGYNLGSVQHFLQISNTTTVCARLTTSSFLARYSTVRLHLQHYQQHGELMMMYDEDSCDKVDSSGLCFALASYFEDGTYVRNGSLEGFVYTPALGKIVRGLLPPSKQFFNNNNNSSDDEFSDNSENFEATNCFGLPIVMVVENPDQISSLLLLSNDSDNSNNNNNFKIVRFERLDLFAGMNFGKITLDSAKNASLPKYSIIKPTFVYAENLSTLRGLQSRSSLLSCSASSVAAAAAVSTATTFSGLSSSRTIIQPSSSTTTTSSSRSYEQNEEVVTFMQELHQHFHEKQIFAPQDIHVGTILSEGGQGIVYSGSFANRPVAIKMFSCLKEGIDEAKLCSALTHKNIISFVGVSCYVSDAAALMSSSRYAAHNKPRLLLLLEIGECSLSDVIKHDIKLDTPFNQVFSEVSFALQMAAAFNYLHCITNETKTGVVVHNDVKPANFIIFNDCTVVKLIDLGIAVTSLKESLTSVTLTAAKLGTRVWSSYEQRTEHDRALPSRDVYSYGVILFNFITGLHPGTIINPSDEEQLKNGANLLLKALDEKPSRPGCPEFLKIICRECMKSDKELRCQNGGEIVNLFVKFREELSPTLKRQLDSIVAANQQSWKSSNNSFYGDQTGGLHMQTEVTFGVDTLSSYS